MEEEEKMKRKLYESKYPRDEYKYPRKYIRGYFKPPYIRSPFNLDICSVRQDLSRTGSMQLIF